MIHNIDCKNIFRTSKQYTPSKHFNLVKFNNRQKKTCSSCLANPQYFGIASGLHLITNYSLHGFSEGKAKLKSDTLLCLGLFSVKLVDGPGSSFRSSI